MALEKVGVRMDHLDLRAERWEEMRERLLRFRARYGHVDVPTRYPTDLELGRWVAMQRNRYRNGALKPERLQRLRALRFFESVDR